MLTQDDVIQITRSLGICELTSKPKQNIHYSLTIHEMLEAFKLVIEAEREACAQVCEGFEGQHRYVDDIVEAIRARGQQ